MATSSRHRLLGGIARTAAGTTPSAGGATIVLNSVTLYSSTPDVRRCGWFDGVAMDVLSQRWGQYRGFSGADIDHDCETKSGERS